MALTKREEDFSKRYNELVEQAGLAQHSDVRGCMVIKPYGYAIRENMQQILDRMFKATWHQNAYFPLFIPKSFFSKEAKHVDGFAKEAAVVTHYRLKNENNQIVVDPEAKLEEELIVRPTSETIIRNTYRDWISSYRDLPILVNQRANVVRREMRTRLFLRTSEFLWQEWHTAHATAEEAIQETKQMRDVYQDFFNHFLAMSGVPGEKSPNERFAWAENTYTVECMMQDGKALQACTSHFLWQNFGKAFDVTFTDKENKLDHAWATSRWASTRMMWWLIMSHSDDKGLVLPPAIAPIHVVIVPIWKTEEDRVEIERHIDTHILPSIVSWSLTIRSNYLWNYALPITYKIDWDDQKTPWWKFAQYELQWVPTRITIWARDLQNNNVEVYRRDNNSKEIVEIWRLSDYLISTLTDIQDTLYDQTKSYRIAKSVSVDNYDEFKQALQDGKFVYAHRDGTSETEDIIKDETKATIRCIPMDDGDDLWFDIMEEWTCIRTGKPSKQRVLFALSY